MTTQPTQTAAPIRSSFRLELQGLRALAVGLVLLYHLWPNHLSGGFVGVDVFFVVSGFLITGHLYRELSQTGHISLPKFWARRVMRLLPLAFTVLVTSFVAMLLLLPQTVCSMNVRQLLGSLFYIENWVLAADSVDYMAADNEPSLVQHYWSLSIEEQFYVLLPLIFVGTYLLTKQRRKQLTQEQHARRVIIWSLAGIIVLSFVFSIGFTNYNSAQAYFVTPTRFWEFATGGLLAMLPATSRLPIAWKTRWDGSALWRSSSQSCSTAARHHSLVIRHCYRSLAQHCLFATVLISQALASTGGLRSPLRFGWETGHTLSIFGTGRLSLWQLIS